MQIWDEIKQRFNKGGIITRLIYINVGVFVALRLLGTFATILIPDFTSANLLEWLAVPVSLTKLIYRLWTVVTYQFVHYDFLHLIFNMLWLYWFGALFMQHFLHRHVLSVYLLGGLFGAGLYLISFNTVPYFQDLAYDAQMIGASASILALVTATATAAPNQTMQLMFVGPVKLKYLALATIVIDFVSITSSNAGGHIAHLGGAFIGYLFASSYLKRNNDISLWITKGIDSFRNFFKARPQQTNMKARHTSKTQSDREYNKTKKQKSKEIDRILDKIKTSGYDSLSKKEKEELFKASH